MSHVDNKYEKSYVMTYKELVFTFLVFVVLLVILFPKGVLKEQILAEKDNYDLSMLYLKNLLQHDPTNESLMLILAEQSLLSGKKDLSLRLLELLLRSEDLEHRKKATVLSYHLKKDDYFYFQSEEKKLQEKKILEKMFLKIMEEKMYSEDDIDRWYKESIFIENYKYMDYFITKKLQEEPENIALLKQAYYISLKLKHNNKAISYAKSLSKLDTVDKNRWEMDGYYLLINSENYREAEKVLNKFSDDSIEWKMQHADFFAMRGLYYQAYEKYMEIFHLMQTYDSKKQYFVKAIDNLQAGNHLKRASMEVKKYEHLYLKDKEMRKYILKLYIATGDLDNAAALSERILQKVDR